MNSPCRYGGVLVMDGHLSIGKLITFQLYWNQIQSGYQTVMQVLMSLTRAAGAAQRVLSLVDALVSRRPLFAGARPCLTITAERVLDR